ncbi:MAG TPA: diguanylate cyclase [Myxococcaceae bacterium]|nr:diguanylate cyclase [Myxococcaceae bacterium]
MFGQRLVLILEHPSKLPALESLARSEGADVLFAPDGAEGLKVACNHEVDLVLAAADVPGMDGLQVLKKLRDLDHRRYVPVVIVLDGQDPAQKLEALRLGADDVIARPWDEQEVRARIARALLAKQRFDEVLEESARLHRLSVTDGLTSIYNHRYFQDRLREEFRRAQRYDDPLALLLLDLDHFKDINEAHGHEVGDEVLRDLATALRKSVRETDIVARYGGEEFAILLPKTHLAGALTVAERVWREVGALRLGPGQKLRITASLGVSGYPARSVISADRLLRTADEALYRAKHEGRNKICLYQQTPLPSDPASTARAG